MSDLKYLADELSGPMTADEAIDELKVRRSIALEPSAFDRAISALRREQELMQICKDLVETGNTFAYDNLTRLIDRARAALRS